MTRENSKDRILKAAEELFSRNGFDGTSVDRIAEEATVNKALIYYYFKNKEDIIVSLFEIVQDDLTEYLKKEFESNDQNISFEKKIKKEIEYLKGRKKIISLLLMESFKDKNADFLFKCAEIHFNSDTMYSKKDLNNPQMKKLFISEFFTGFIPILAFITYEDEWCKYFNCKGEKLSDLFLDALLESHFTSHTK